MASRPVSWLELLLTPPRGELSPPPCGGPPIPGSHAFIFHSLCCCMAGTSLPGAAGVRYMGGNFLKLLISKNIILSHTSIIELNIKRLI